MLTWSHFSLIYLSILNSQNVYLCIRVYACPSQFCKVKRRLHGGCWRWGKSMEVRNLWNKSMNKPMKKITNKSIKKIYENSKCWKNHEKILKKSWKNLWKKSIKWSLKNQNFEEILWTNLWKQKIIHAYASCEVSNKRLCMHGMGSERSEPLRAREESQPAGLE